MREINFGSFLTMPYLIKGLEYGKFLIKSQIFQKDQVEHLLISKKYLSPLSLFRLKYSNSTSSQLFGKTIGITGSFWYLHSLKEIFVEETYKFNSETKTPFILDCGSNIGLSVIYFKRLFPEAKIVAFEPDKEIFNLLQNNLAQFEYGGIELQNKAVWIEDTQLDFSSNGNLGGSVYPGVGSGSSTNQVSAARLRDYLSQEVDFLKLDIEGAEFEVLSDCSDLLKNVKNLFVEYHSFASKEQELDKLLSILKHAGFTVYIKEAWNNLPLPFLYKDYKPWYNLQLNIFAYRML